MLVSSHISTRRHNPEHNDVNLHRRENLRCRIMNNTACSFSYKRHLMPLNPVFKVYKTIVLPAVFMCVRNLVSDTKGIT